MKADRIKERRTYPYTRRVAGQVRAGRIRVGQVYADAAGRMRVIGVDVASGVQITLWPACVLDKRAGA